MAEPVIPWIGKALADAKTALTEQSIRHPIAAATIATAVASAVFLAWPGIDTGVAGLFHGVHPGFPVSQVPFFVEIRDAGRMLTEILVWALVIAVVLRVALPRLLAFVKPSALTFLIATLAIGPGLVVNRILKEFWGRARPIDTDLFGGSHAFSLPWEIADGCIRNCSFVSGEASAAMWLIAFAFVVPKAWQRATVNFALIWTIVISFNRMAIGGHYFSDVVIGWGVTMIIVLALRELILIRYAERIDSGEVSEAIGAWMKALWHRHRPQR